MATVAVRRRALLSYDIFGKYLLQNPAAFAIINYLNFDFNKYINTFRLWSAVSCKQFALNK